jgi:hypothetical protein
VPSAEDGNVAQHGQSELTGSIQKLEDGSQIASDNIDAESGVRSSLKDALQDQTFDELFSQLLTQDPGAFFLADNAIPGLESTGTCEDTRTSHIVEQDSTVDIDTRDQRSPEMDIAALRKRVKRQIPPARMIPEDGCNTLNVRRNNGIAERGVLLFWNGLSNAIPLFCSLKELNEALHCTGCDSIDLQSIELLRCAVATLGYALFEGHKSPNFISMRRSSLENLHDFRQSNVDTAARDSLVRCTAGAILVCYATFGCGEVSDLAGHKTSAITFARAARLESIDRDVTTSSGTTMFTWISPQFQSLARRSFWELHILDSVFHVATSGQVKRLLMMEDEDVGLPTCDPDLHVDVKGAWELRRKTARLLFDCVHSKILEEDSPALSLASADTLCANTIAEAELAFLKLTRSAAPRLQRDHDHFESVVRQCQTVVFDCLIMLHVSRLHLHRVTWFSDISMGMRSCSFKRSEGDIYSDHNEVRFDEVQTWADARLESVEKISKCATSILSLLQMDTDAFFKRNIAQIGVANVIAPLIPIHWPIIGCCKMAASYGLFVNLVSEDDTEAEDADQMQLLPGHGSRSSLRVHRRREFLSGVKLTAVLLEQMGDVWQISLQYLDQVEQCRKAVTSDVNLTIEI